MPQLLKNNVSGVLASGINAVQTSITLVDASSFPSPTGGDFFLATLIGLNGNGQESSWEIVRCTARSTNTLTVVRGQEGTSAAPWGAATTIQLRVTAGTFSEYAALASPTFTGTPAAPTAAADTNTTQVATTAYVVGQAASASPAMNGTAAVGTSLRYARADHVHASDTSRAPLASPTFTGTPAAPTAAANTNTTQLATTAFVLGQGNATAGTIAMNGTQAAGTSNLYARADHVHPTDTSRAPLASPTFTGTPAAPTAAADTNTTQLATTAYVVGQGYLKSAAASSTYLPLAGGTMTGAITFAGGQTFPGTGDVTLSGTQTLTNKTLSGGVYSGNVDQTGSVRGGITAVGALDINCSLGNYFTKTINGNSTFTVSNVPASRAYAFTLELTHTSGTVTWFSGVQWPGGTAPTLTTGKVHLFTFVTDDGGTSWRGASQVNYNS